jgi:hypothetical protein
MNILQIGFTTEGSTDERFLGRIIERTFEHELMKSDLEIEMYQPVHLDEKADTFNKKIERIATKYSWFHVICVHCDADAPTSENVMQHKILPALEQVQQNSEACRNLVTIIPVQMTEAWMLADIDLFIKEISSSKSCDELELPCKARLIESIADPKARIENALRIDRQKLTRRRTKLRIADIYTPLGQKIPIEALNALPSFNAFKANVTKSLINLNYIQPN